MFKEIFEQSVVDPPVRSQKAPRKHLYPSSASLTYMDPDLHTTETVGTCLRAEYYYIKGETPTEGDSASGVLKMNAGNVLQPMVEHAFKMAGLWRASETSFFHKKMKLSGRVDFWLADPTQVVGEREVLVPGELKTIGKYAEAGCCFPKAGKMMPKLDHILQCIPYIDHYSQFIPETKLVIFYLGRDSMELGEHAIWLAGKGEYGCPVDDDERYVMVRNLTGTYALDYVTVKGVYKRYYALAKYVRAGEEPPPDYEDQWDNRRIKAYVDAGPGFGKVNKTECKAVEKALDKEPGRVDDDSRPLLEKGDWQCRYCSFYTRCRTGLKHMPKPVFRDQALNELTPAEAPVVDDEETPV